MSETLENKGGQGSDTGKIVMIYVCVAVICAIIISCFMYLGRERDKLAVADTDKASERAVAMQLQLMKERVGIYDIVKLEKDFTAKNQNGEVVSLQSLRGKVWVFAQFYGSCPECNKVNFEILGDLYEKHKGNPNFRIVTMSIMKEDDGVASMKQMAEAQGVDSDGWWFLTADVDAVNEFCSENMKYVKFMENKDKSASGMQGAIFHDMGMAVFNADMIMKAKVDVFSPLNNKNTLLADLKTQQLDLEVKDALKSL